MYPENLRYTKTHEWIRIEGNVITFGITFYAQKQLLEKGGGITYVGVNAPEVPPDQCQLPEIGALIKREEEFMIIECSKSTEGIFSPVDGKIVAVNEGLRYRANLDIIHRDPYGEGWFVKIKIDDPTQLSGLMDASQYQEFLRQGG